MITRQQAYWICQLSGWNVYAVANTLLLRAYVPVNTRATIGVLCYGFIGILVTHALRHYIRRSALLSKSWGQIIVRSLVLMPLTAATLTAFVFLNWWLWSSASMAAKPLPQFSIALGTFFNMNFLIALWLVIYIAVHTVWRGIAMRESQLLALQAQINPHFLFNALNGLRGLIGENPAAAQDAVTRLSQLMRYSLNQSRRPTVPLSEELEAVRDYLAIETMRFDDRLQIDWQIEPGLDNLEVPPMSLQTLVENALKHGIAHAPSGGQVQIQASATNHVLRLGVTNPGPLTRGEPGTGLANLQQRLQLLGGESATFQIHERDGRVTAEIHLPIQ